ncbi:MAG: archaeal proteasome endopeptidase complex subunit alpha [archaeon]
MYPVSRNAAYDRAITVFSPDGKLYQVEYASKITEKGTSGVGIIYDKGVLFGADKMIHSKLLVPDSIEKMFKVDDHITAISSGLSGDARRLVQYARELCQENKGLYDEPLQVEVLVKRVAAVTQYFTQYGGIRPFGVSFIFGGVDEFGKRLFESEPNGALAEYKAIAIGRNKNAVMGLLEKEFKEKLSLDEALSLAVSALKKSLPADEKMSDERLEFSIVDEKMKYKKIKNEKIASFK